MDHKKNIWMAIRAIALDSGFYRPFFSKDSNGNAIQEKPFEGLQLQINSPRQDMFTDLPCENLSFDLLECHNTEDISFPEPDKD